MAIRNYLSLIKFSHTVFAMPFAVVGFFIDAPSDPDWWLFGKVILCMIFARSAAMAFNRWADQNIDARNARTRIREIPSGVISGQSALVFVIINSFLFVLTTYFINSLCFYLSPVALLVVLGYSYTKRFTPLCHLVLGLGLSLAPIGAYLALHGEFAWAPLFFSALVLLWVSGFDIIYALQDEEFDRANGLRSIPVLLGKKNALLLSRTLHALAILPLTGAGLILPGGIWYWIGAGVFVVLLIYQHSLVKHDDLSKVNLAFFTTNGFASVVFAMCFLADKFL